MLTEEQKNLMSQILESSKEIEHDKKQIDLISTINTEILEYFNVSVFPNAEFKQVIKAKIQHVEPFTYNIHTLALVTGTSITSITESYEMIAAREQNEIVNKLEQLKATI